MFNIEDFFKNAAGDIGTTGGAAVGLVLGTPSGAGAIATSAIGGTIGETAMDTLTARLIADGTRGYKKKTLVGKDAGKMVTITLKTDGGMIIRSPDGVSETQVKVVDINFDGTEGVTKG